MDQAGCSLAQVGVTEVLTETLCFFDCAAWAMKSQDVRGLLGVRDDCQLSLGSLHCVLRDMLDCYQN